jgi:hypothetical protein
LGIHGFAFFGYRVAVPNVAFEKAEFKDVGEAAAALKERGYWRDRNSRHQMAFLFNSVTMDGTAEFSRTHAALLGMRFLPQ